MKGIRVVALLSLALGLSWASDLQLRQSESSNASPTIIQEEKSEDSVANMQVSKNFSIKANTIANEGYSEFELETGKANLNEIDAPISRYGVGIKFDYSFKPDARVKLNFFVSNALEINAKRRGGKVKPYNDGTLYEENVYDYGSVKIHSGWVNSIGMTLTILGVHKIALTMKQTQFASADSPNANVVGAPRVNIADLSGNPALNQPLITTNTWGNVTTQSFLTYTYVF